MQTPEEALLIRYGEIGLKGGNRPHFEKKLVAHLRVALAGVPGVRIQRIRGRMLVRGEAPAREMAAIARKVFGITSLSPALIVAREPAPMLAAARRLAGVRACVSRLVVAIIAQLTGIDSTITALLQTALVIAAIAVHIPAGDCDRDVAHRDALGTR